jgi:hypothetical protein
VFFAMAPHKMSWLLLAKSQPDMQVSATPLTAQRTKANIKLCSYFAVLS